MNHATRLLLFSWGFIVLVGLPAAGQSVSNYAVQVTASVQRTPPCITLSWVPDSPDYGYSLARRLKDDLSWGPVTSLSSNAVGFVDSNVVAGACYEYSLFKDFKNFVGEGYIAAGIDVPLTEARGKVLLLVENSHATSLALELARLQQDLVGDGWTVLRHDVPRMAVDPANTNSSVWSARSNEVASLKALIKTDYDADPDNVKAVFLLGHLPVPYSGNLNPDGHPDHQGAWPADVYYGDISGAWTDSSVNITTASDRRNWNVPGDGKFDQTELTSVVKLQVGRVDFANLPAFPQGERGLLRQYLNKDHAFRHGHVPVQRRGLIDDNFGILAASGEAFAVNGWRNFAPFFGPSNIVTGDWLTTRSGQSYLWAYGCGGGTYTSASGVARTWNLVTNDTPFVFTMLFGSYFGDWDSQNNFMRAQLATATYTLSCAWAGRPYWYFHHMGLGETIGFSTQLSQNGSYGTSLALAYIHVALMGDPTLRMHPVAPPSALLVASNGSGGVDLSWRPSPGTVVGYHVYRASSAAGPFTRLTTNLVIGNTYTDPELTTNVYMVRAVKLEETPSGSYSNLSQGVFQSLDGNAGAAQIVLFQPTNNALFISPASIPLGASLFDPANSVTNVTFYANGLKIADVPGPFYALTWTNAPAGQYALVARASCSSGAVTSSTPVSVRVVGLSPTLAIAAAGGGTFAITGDGIPGLTYKIQGNDDLSSTNWQPLGTVTPDPSGRFQFSASPGPTQRFYRSVYP